MRACSTKPCAGCPFARATPPGDIGGSSPLVYIGQSVGPFNLPCHNAPGYYDNRHDLDHRQCAGAAIYRTHVGVASKMPPSIATLPEDHDLVFSSHAEFLAHHTGLTVDRAEGWLDYIPPAQLLITELSRSTVKFHAIPH